MRGFLLTPPVTAAGTRRVADRGGKPAGENRPGNTAKPMDVVDERSASSSV
jgi:hypothetical protein